MKNKRRPTIWWITAGAIAVVLAAGTVWSYSQRADLPRQKRVVTDLQTIALALSHFNRQNGGMYPVDPRLVGSDRVPRSFDAHVPELWVRHPRQDVSLLRPQLGPSYTDGVGPVLDPWGSTYLYAVSADRRHYVLIARGSDRRIDLGSVPLTWPYHESWRDVVVADGKFVSYPYGVSVASAGN